MKAKETRKQKVLHWSKLLCPQNTKKASTKETRVGSTMWEIVKNQGSLGDEPAMPTFVTLYHCGCLGGGKQESKTSLGSSMVFRSKHCCLELVDHGGYNLKRSQREILEERQRPLWDVKARKQRCLQGLPCEQLQKKKKTCHLPRQGSCGGRSSFLLVVLFDIIIKYPGVMNNT